MTRSSDLTGDARGHQITRFGKGRPATMEERGLTAVMRVALCGWGDTVQDKRARAGRGRPPCMHLLSPHLAGKGSPGFRGRWAWTAGDGDLDVPGGPDGRQRLLPWPGWAYAEDTLADVARWPRGYHIAVAGTSSRRPGRFWRLGAQRHRGQVIGHNDAAPWPNAVWRAGLTGRIHRLGHGRAGGPGVGCRVRGAFGWVPLSHARHVAVREGFYRVLVPGRADCAGSWRSTAGRGPWSGSRFDAAGPGRRPHGTGPAPRRPLTAIRCSPGWPGRRRRTTSTSPWPSSSRSTPEPSPAPAASTKLCRAAAELITAVAPLRHQDRLATSRSCSKRSRPWCSERLRDRFRPCHPDQTPTAP